MYQRHKKVTEQLDENWVLKNMFNRATFICSCSKSGVYSTMAVVGLCLSVFWFFTYIDLLHIRPTDSSCKLFHIVLCRVLLMMITSIWNGCLSLTKVVFWPIILLNFNLFLFICFRIVVSLSTYHISYINTYH